MDKPISINKRPPYGMIVILMIGGFIAILNNTLLNIALPSMMKDLNVEAATVQWLATGYMLVNGILIPTTAFLIQKFSARSLFLSAMGLFTIGTILAGFAYAFPLLLTGRMIQASGSAILMPLLMNVMLTSFSVEKRGSAMGVFGMVIMGGPAIGPTLSGWILEHYDWRMLFHFLTPIAVVIFLVGFFLLKDKKDPVKLRLDTISVILSSVGFGGILYGFSSAGANGWDDPWVVGTLILGILSLTVFIIKQLKTELPMLNFRIFQYPMYSLSALISIVVTMLMFSGMMLLPIYVQTVRGISPLDAGLMVMPGAIIMGIMSPITGKLFDRFGGKVLAILGLAIITVSSYYFSILTFDTSYFYLMVLFSFRMLGMSMVLMPVTTNGLNQLPAKYYPHGTAMNNTLQQVAGAIGTALLVSIMSNRSASYAKELSAEATKGLEGQGVNAEALAALQQDIALKAMLEGINFAFFVSLFIACIGLILAFFIKRANQQEDVIASDPAGETIITEIAKN